jgi:hypothetical protein
VSQYDDMFGKAFPAAQPTPESAPVSDEAPPESVVAETPVQTEEMPVEAAQGVETPQVEATEPREVRAEKSTVSTAGGAGMSESIFGGAGGAAPQASQAPEAATAAPSVTPPSGAVALGRGLDIGTANLVSAVQSNDGIKLNIQRNAFIDVRSDVYTKNMLTRLQVPYAVQGGRLVVLGDAAFELANIFGRETRRPMKDGMISPAEIDALPVIQLLIDRVLGKPAAAGEKVYYSVPAEPIDRDMNVTYHQGIFDGLLRKMGYEPRPIVEGHCVALSELADDGFTGIGVSCGGGMFNICVSYKTIPALTFSTARAGDWVDQNVAAVCGIPVSKATLVKEEGVDLMNPQGREQEAVSIYYRNLINYTLTNIKHRFESTDGMPVFPEPIQIVASGGTSLVGNFIECFKDEFKKIDFPIPVKVIRHAEDPLMTVAKGALIAAAISDD